MAETVSLGFDEWKGENRLPHLLHDPLTLAVNAAYSRWRFGGNPEAFGGQGSPTQEYGDGRPPLRGIVKTEWPGTILAELFWFRLVRLADLPAAPVLFAEHMTNSLERRDPGQWASVLPGSDREDQR